MGCWCKGNRFISVTCYATWTHLYIMGFSLASFLRTFHTLFCSTPAAIYRQNIFKHCVSDCAHINTWHKITQLRCYPGSRAPRSEDVEERVDFRPSCLCSFSSDHMEYIVLIHAQISAEVMLIHLHIQTAALCQQCSDTNSIREQIDCIP